MQALRHRPSPAGVALVAPASSPARWRRHFVAAAALTLVALCGCALFSHRQSTSDLLILGENPVFEPFTGFSTAGMASENPKTGATFAHLIQMAYECTEELKRSLRGLNERDYDAEVRVSFIETLILKLVDRLADDEGRDDVPDFQHLPRGASFKTAVHKIAVFARLVKLLPNEDWFQTDNMRAVQYGEIRYDLRMIAQALRREVKTLQYRHFDSHEPAIPHYIRAQRTIRGTVGRLTSQHPAEWAELGVDFQKQLDFGMPLRASQEPLALGATRPAALGVLRPVTVYRPVQRLRKLPMLDIHKAVTNKVRTKAAKCAHCIVPLMRGVVARGICASSLRCISDAELQVLDSQDMILKTKKNMRILVGNQYEIDVPSSHSSDAHMLNLHNGVKVSEHPATPEQRTSKPVSLAQKDGSGVLLFYGHKTSGGALSGEAMPMDELEEIDHISPEHVELLPVSDSKSDSVL